MSKITEQDLVDAGFSKNLMPGTGWLTTNSMRDAVYYYEKGRIAVNVTEFWTWFLDDKQRNDIEVSTKEGLIELLNKYQHE